MEDPAGAWLLEAQMLQRRGKYAAARRLLTSYVARWPLDARPHLRRAEMLLAEGQAAAAVMAARRALRRAPAMLEARKLFAAALLADGRTATACDALAAAVALAPGDAALRRQLGQARLADQRPRDALASMLVVLRLAPDDAETGLAAAQLLVLLHRRDDAIALLQRMVQISGAAAPLHVELARLLGDAGQAAAGLAVLDALAETPEQQLCRGHLLTLLGRQAEAAGLGAAPGAGQELRHHRLLLRQAQAEGTLRATLLGLDAQLGTAAVPVGERIAACFSVARHWFDESEPDRAFACLHSGHRLLSRFEPFDIAQQEALGEAMIRAFSAARMRHGARAGNADTAPVFIVGMPRSGTTLAEQILAAHAEVHGAGERQALGSMASRLAGRRREPGWPARAAALSAAQLDAAAAYYLAALHALAPQARYVVDKMPGNFQWLGLAGLMLPGARIIHCVRDPRDIGLSIYTRRFDAPHPYAHDLENLGWYIGWQQRLMAHWQTVLPNAILKLRLHDWIHDFNRTLQRVLAFLELPDDESCAMFYALERDVKTASREQVRRPINDDGMSRWRLYETQLIPLVNALRRAGAL